MHLVIVSCEMTSTLMSTYLHYCWHIYEHFNSDFMLRWWCDDHEICIILAYVNVYGHMIQSTNIVQWIEYIILYHSINWVHHFISFNELGTSFLYKCVLTPHTNGYYGSKPPSALASDVLYCLKSWQMKKEDRHTKGESDLGWLE